MGAWASKTSGNHFPYPSGHVLEAARMRGSTARQISMLSAITPDELVPLDHPIRRIRPIVELALASLSRTFDAMYAEDGRPSFPPEHLLRGCF